MWNVNWKTPRATRAYKGQKESSVNTDKYVHSCPNTKAFSIWMLADSCRQPSDLFWLAQPEWLILLLQSLEPNFWVQSFTFRDLRSLTFGNFTIFKYSMTLYKIDQKIKCADTPLHEYQVRFEQSWFWREELEYRIAWTVIWFESYSSFSGWWSWRLWNNLQRWKFWHPWALFIQFWFSLQAAPSS